VRVPSAKPRVQVTFDPELAAAVAEFGAEAMRAERADRREAREHLLRIAAGDDDGYDFAVSEGLHASR
jgi:hypothetical protein